MVGYLSKMSSQEVVHAGIFVYDVQLGGGTWWDICLRCLARRWYMVGYLSKMSSQEVVPAGTFV